MLLPFPPIQAYTVTAPTVKDLTSPESGYNALGVAFSRSEVSKLIYEELSEVEPYRASILHDRMMKTIACESGFKNIQSNIVKDGIREDSWGIAQIHLPSHPKFTRLQALDLQISIAFMADAFINREYNMWSCYRQIYN